jgi:hypothetical protein
MQSRRAEKLPKGSRLVITVLIASLWVIQVRRASAFAASPVQEDTTARVDAVDTTSQRIALGPQKPSFDPDRVAYLEATGWQAYYDRNWPRVLSLMVQMNREQFRMTLPTATAAAIDIVRASIAFAPIDNDVPAATAHLQRFYDKARCSRDLHAEAQTLAALEMNYWVVHRTLALERQQAPDHTGDIEPMVASLASMHAALFDATPEAIHRSAELRAEAARTVDRITGGYSTDVAGDWCQVEATLREAYRSLKRRL